MKTILTYGTFDLFHVGHVRLLKRLKEMGDRLIVAVSTDEFNQKKGKESFFSYEERVEILNSIEFVDEVIAESDWEQKRNDIKKYNVDIFAIGDDWKGKFDDLSDICEVRYLKRTENVSTTGIKESLSKINSESLDELESNLKDVLKIIRNISNQ